MSPVRLRKIVVLGHPNSGKTSLLREITGKEPEPQNLMPYSLVEFRGFEFFELQSLPEQRSRWIHQCRASTGILYVLNSQHANEELIDLKELLQLENLKHCSLFIAITHGSEQRPIDLSTVILIHESTVGYFNLVEGTIRGSFDELRGWISNLL